MLISVPNSSTAHTTQSSPSPSTLSTKHIVALGISTSIFVAIMTFGIAFVTVNLRRKYKNQRQEPEDSEKPSIFSRHKGFIRPLKARHPEHIITPFMGRRFSVVHIAPQYNPGVETHPVARQRPDGTWGIDTPDSVCQSPSSSVDPRTMPYPPSPTYHQSPRRVASQPDMRTRARVYAREARPQTGHSDAPAYPPGISRSPTPTSTSSRSSRSSAATVEMMHERLRGLREHQMGRLAPAPPPVPRLPPLPPPPPYSP